MAALTDPQEDAVVPTRIEHRVDMDIDEASGEVLYYYNYLVYTFAHPAGNVLARSYLDDAGTVAIYLPDGVTEHDANVRPVVAYLKRRYGRITRLGPRGYVEIDAAS